MEISNSAIGNRIREVRELKGYTREQLAEYAEISANFLWEIETGRKSLKVQNLGKIASALDVTTDYLIYGTKSHKGNEKINSMITAMPEDIQEQFEKITTAFMDTLRICKRKKNAKDGSENE